MANPVLVEVVRGAIVESVHRGSIAVCDSDGRLLHQMGMIDQPVYPRSAMKLIQALPLVESGAADAYGFGDIELSMACASHSSEEGHVAVAQKMLSAAGLSETDLECGAHWPLIGEAGSTAKIALARAGKTPSQLHNNCSGKHAGFLCCAKHAGVKTKGYTDPNHELQREILNIMSSVCGEVIEQDQCSFDGCSAPTYAVSLKALATGFAKLSTGQGVEPVRAKSANRLLDACMAQPWYMAGTERFCTKIMEIGAGRIFAKLGAEGVYTAAIPALGIGIAIKADDGAERGCEMMLAGILAKLMGKDDKIGDALNALTIREIRNWNGIKTGYVRSVKI